MMCSRNGITCAWIEPGGCQVFVERDQCWRDRYGRCTAYATATDRARIENEIRKYEERRKH